MRCNQELYGHINCDRDVILGEKYCKFHFVPSLRIEIEKLQAENAKLRECVEFYANFMNYSNLPEYGCGVFRTALFSDMEEKNDFTKYGGYRARQVLKELEEE